MYFTREDEKDCARAAAFRRASGLMCETLAANGFSRVRCEPPDFRGSNPSARGAVGRTFWQTAPALLQYEFLAMPSESVQENLLVGLLTRVMASAELGGTVYVSDTRIANGVLDASRNPEITELKCVRTFNITRMCPRCGGWVAWLSEEGKDISPVPLLRQLQDLSEVPRGDALSEAKKLLKGYPVSLEGLKALESLLGRWPDMPGQNIRIKPDFVSWRFNFYPGISAAAYSDGYVLGEGGMGGVNASGWFGEGEAAVLTGVLAAQNMAEVFLKSGSLTEAATKERCG